LSNTSDNQKDCLTLPSFFGAFSVPNLANNKVYLLIDTVLLVIDGRINEVIKRISVPLGNSSIYLPPFVWNPYNNKIYYFPYERDKIYLLDGLRDSLIDSIDTHGKMPMRQGLVHSERWDKLYILAEDTIFDIYILFLDCERNQIFRELRANFPVGRHAYNPMRNLLYTTSETGSHKVMVIDLNQGALVDSIVFPEDIAVCNLIFAPRHKILYCFIALDTLAWMVDGDNLSIIGNITLPGYYYGIADFAFYHPLRDKIYFLNDGLTIAIIDCATNQVVEEIYPGVGFTGHPYDLFLNPLTNRLYATEADGPWIMVFDAEENRAVRQLNLQNYIGKGRGIGYGAVCSQLNKIYFSCGGGPIVVLDGNTDRVLTVIWDIPDYKKLYYLEGVNKIFAVPPTALFAPPWTYVIDCSTDMVIDEIRTGSPTYGFGYSPRTNKVYIASGYGGYGWSKTRIIDAASHRIIKVIDNVCGDIEYDPREERFYISDGWPSCDLFQARRIEQTNVRDSVKLPRSLFILDGFRDSILHYLRGAEGYDIALDTIDRRIYIISYDYPNYYLKILDLETLGIDTIEESEGCLGELFWNPINDKIYFGRFEIKALDCRRNQVVWEYPEKGYLDISAWHPFQNRLYLATPLNRLLVIRDEISGISKMAKDSKIKEIEILPSLGSSFRISWYGEKEIKLLIYNVLGRKVKEFNLKPNSSLIWNGKDEKLPSGVYILKVKRNKGETTAKIILK